MTKMAEGKKIKPVSDVARPQNGSVGEMLRVARLAKNLSIEDVAAALRIRHVQLQAIEENNIEALPGMTYAVGFVRSYANFVGLNGVEMVHRFKVEQGYAPDQSKLSFPEPIAESRMPDPLMVGIGSFLAILVLVLWTLYSNMSNGSGKDTEQIQPAPAAATTYETPAESLPLQPETPPVAAALAPVSAPAGRVDAVPELPAAAVETPAPAEALLKETPVKKAPLKVVAPAADEDAASVIKIKRDESRIELRANQASWVQITDAKGEVIYKKVLRPGDQYYVPDQTGLSLVTANAGGLEIYVDGQKIQALGQSGEIVRGIGLDPAELRRKRPRVRE